MAIDNLTWNKVHFLPKFTLDSISVSPKDILVLFILTCLADFLCKFINQTIKRSFLKVLNLLLLNIANSCEKVLMTFLKATCICVQAGQRL